MFITLKALNLESVKSLIKSLNKKEFIFMNSPHIYEAYNYFENKIVFYNNLTITIEGKSINQTLKINLINNIMDPFLYTGSDEVGIGEPIGPIIVCALSFRDLKQKEEFFLMGIIDSKKMTYEKINYLGKKLEEKTIYKCQSINVENFNHQMKIKTNIKLLNAILHNEVHTNLSYLNRQIVIDEFVNQKKYNHYINSTNKVLLRQNHLFATKAESKYLEVAGAAILAKYKFNKWVEKTTNKFNINLYKYIKNNINYQSLYKEILTLEISEEEKNKIIKKWK